LQAYEIPIASTSQVTNDQDISTSSANIMCSDVSNVYPSAVLAEPRREKVRNLSMKWEGTSTK
jgi:hypothetical protein